MFRLALVSLALSAASAGAGPIGVVSFGDSLSDTGNAFLGTGGAQPPSPPYFPGRFSNGPVWVEYLAAGLGLPAPTPFLAGGRNYAVGGAESGTGTSGVGAPNLLAQLGLYLGTSPPTANRLFTVWAGANDFLNGQTNPLVPAANVSAAIQALAAAGAQQFVVANLPDLGDIPGSLLLPPFQRAGLNALTAQYNAALAGQLDGLRATGLTITLLDVNDLYKDIRANPSAFGFTNATTAALPGNPSGAGFLFYDSLHPTTAAHRLAANRALAALAVPEPGTFAVVGLAGVFVLRRGRRA